LSVARAGFVEARSRLSDTRDEHTQALELASSLKRDVSLLEERVHALALANQKTSELLAEANARVTEKSHENDAMRSTLAWKLHELLQRARSRFCRKRGVMTAGSARSEVG